MAMDPSALDQSKTSSSPIFPPSSLSAGGINHCPGADISWMMLDRFVFRRDGSSFPDDRAAPMRAKSVTSVGDLFMVALVPAAPPAVSRLYVQWPRSPRELELEQIYGRAAELVTAHRSLLLLRITSPMELGEDPYRQDYFVFKAAPFVGVNSRLTRLPACTEPIVLPLGGREITVERWFHHDTIGLVSGAGDGNEFAVVQLAKFVDIPGSSPKMGAELCLFRSCLSSSKSNGDDGVVAEGKWEVLTLPIHHREEEFSDLQGWSTDGAITFNKSICWVDYHHGGILSYTPPPLAGGGGGGGGGESIISYVRLPINNRPHDSLPSKHRLEMYRSLCVTSPRGNEQLKFVDVARSDGAFFGPIGHGSSFTITCHTFTQTDDQMWHKDAVIKSGKLQYLNARKPLMPHNAVTTFPLVSRDEPHLVHFVVSEQRNKISKVSVVVIDIITQKIVSVFPYIQGNKDLCGEDADMVRHRSRLPWSFLPSQF